MDADGYFWAGMSGGRANQIRQLNDAIDEWEAHVAQLNKTINELRASYERVNTIAKDWAEGYVEAAASARVREDAFEEVVGKSVRDHFGNKEIDKRMEIRKQAIRERQGLK